MNQTSDTGDSRLPKLAALGMGAIVLAAGIRLAMPLLRPSKPAPSPAASAPVPGPGPAPNTAATGAGAAPAAGSPSTAGTPSPPATYASAKMEIENTIAVSPKQYDLRIQAAQFYMRAGDHQAALPHLQAATRLKPNEFLPWLALGDAATLAGKTTAAEAAYQRAQKIDPKHPLVARGRGQLLVIQRRFPEARKVLEAALAEHPKDLEIRRALGNLMLLLNKPRLAIKVLKPAVAMAPDSAELHFILGEAHERDLHINEALKEMQAATASDPNMAEAWGRIGLYLINLARHTEAREPAQRAIALDPNVSQYHWVLGDSYLLDTSDPKNFETAVTHYKQSLKLDPNNTKTLYSLAMAYSRYGTQEQVKESIPLLQKLISLVPSDTNAYYKLAEAHRRVGNQKEADKALAKFEEFFEKGRKQTKGLFQGASYVDTAEAHLARAREYLKENRIELAVKFYELAVDRAPNSIPARQELEQARKRLAKSNPAAADARR